MSSISDIKAAFYDSQRQASNLFEAMVSEVLSLNEKLKAEAPATKPEENPKKG
jgi:hypothetical protein